MVMAWEKDDIKLPHLQELMEDAEANGGEPVRAYHTVWLQQLEQGRASWSDEDHKMKYCRALAWYHVMATPPPPFCQNRQQPQPAPGKAQRRGDTFIHMSKPCDMVCLAYDRGACSDNPSHPHV